MIDHDADYVSFFFDAPSGVAQLETLQLSHPAFSKTYWLVRNATQGLAAKIETGQSVFYQYCPMRLAPMTDRGTLDFGISVALANHDEISDELARVRQAGQLSVRPTVTYRTYRTDKLDAPMLGPVRLQAQSITVAPAGASFDAGAPSLNVNRTGQVYSVDRFAMLLRFL